MNPNLESKPCLLCDRPLRRRGADFNGKEIYQCAACDYLTTPVADDEHARELYDNPEYFDGWGCNLEFDYVNFEPSVHQQVNEYLDFLSRYTRGQSLLDVGTGNGLLAYA